jgi:hypothetical protein
MVILFLIAFCAALGFVLYLPFLLWFRRRRKRDRAITVERQFTPFGLLFHGCQLSVLFGGIAVGQLAPKSWLGSLIAGNVGEAIWVIVVWIAFIALALLLHRWGYVTSRQVVRLPVVEGTATKANDGTRTPSEPPPG